MGYLHEIYLAAYDAAPVGTPDGTISNPYYAALSTDTAQSNANSFDALMKDTSKIPPMGACVRILPGNFYTNGYPAVSPAIPWTPTPYMRIRGSGMGATKLVLVATPGATRYAIGMDTSASTVDGFELGDLTIDCGLGSISTNNTSAGAIRVRGSHVLIERVNVTNYGGYVTPPVPSPPPSVGICQRRNESGVIPPV